MLVPDADDPERSKSITGSTQRERLSGARWYYRHALFARTRPQIREYFKPVAQLAATLIAGGSVYFHEEAVLEAAFYITEGGWFGGIYELWGLNLPLGGVKIKPARTGSNAIVTMLTKKATAAARRKMRRRAHAFATATAAAEAAGKARNETDFEFAFHHIFIDEWRQLLWEAQLQASPSQPSTQTQMVEGDARSRALAGELKSAAHEEESREDRRRGKVIRAAAKVGVRGLAYCRFLDHEEIHPSSRLRGCPDTYEAAYKFKKNGGFPWRQAIWDEKSYFSRGLSLSTTDPEMTVN
jgi:hypothetical protein